VQQDEEYVQDAFKLLLKASTLIQVHAFVSCATQYMQTHDEGFVPHHKDEKK